MEQLSHQFSLPAQYDLRRTMWLAGMGYSDPARQFHGQQVAFGVDTPHGLAGVQASLNDSELDIRCWGAGLDWLGPKLPPLFGLHDTPASFRPSDAKAINLVKQASGVYLVRLPRIFERLVQIVLQQLVSWTDAFRGWRLMVERYGRILPGPLELRVGPSAERLQSLGYYDLVDCHVLPKQARLILQLAKQAKRIERLAEEDFPALCDYLLRIRGIGDWTVQYLLGTGWGDSDAVITGDYGLPHSVAWYFRNQPRSNDQEMLEILEPYRGNRFRVLNAIWQAGIEAPKYGPKMKTNRWRFTKR